MTIKNKLSRLLTVCAVALLATACGKKLEYDFTVDFRHAEVDASRGTQFVTVSAAPDQQWTLTVTDEDGNPVEWAVVDPASGTGSVRSVTVTWDQNYTDEARSLIITATSGAESDSRTMTQSAPKSSSGGTLPTTLVPDKVQKWMELPATDDPHLYFFSHATTTQGAGGRNFSYYWDVDALVAHWVAYPLNSSAIGSGSRTNAWALDKKLPRDKQPVLFNGYGSASTGDSDGGTQWYQRGHQLPSADRLNYADNVQTFYGTNMTPQKGELNEGIWAELEGRVRDWARQFDTLYVVTGCVIKGSTEFAYDNEGKKVTVPTGYYKALLGYDKGRAKGITSQTQGYTGVGFYFDHRGYSDDVINHAMTIDELERVVEEDFYVNLPDAIGTSLADRVESTRDSYWWTGK